MESVDCQGVLDDGFGAAWVAGDRAVEDWLGGFATVHGIGDGVGLPFVGVPGAADSAGELGATALLNDVGGFVRGEFYIRFAAATDPIAGGVRECAHARVGVRGGAECGGAGRAFGEGVGGGFAGLLFFFRLGGEDAFHQDISSTGI